MISRRDQEWAGPLSVAAQIVTAVEEETRLPELVSVVLDQSLTTLGVDAAALYLFDAERSRLELIEQRGFPGTFEQRCAVLTLDPQTITGRAAASGQVQSDWVGRPTTLSPDAVERRVCGGLLEWVAAPLRARGQMVGVLTLALRQPGRLGLDEPTIEFIAHAVATGILNARTLEADRRMRYALQAVDEATLAISAELDPRRVLQALVDRAREVTSARYAALGIGTDPDKPFDPWVFSGLSEADSHAIGQFPRARGLLGAVPASGKTIRTPDIARDPRRCGFPSHHPPMRSFLGVPIQAGGEAIGNLYLADKVGADEFSAEDEHSTTSLATHAAIAIQHARLYEQAQQERNRLRVVLEGSPLGIIFIERWTEKVYANRAAEEIFGHAFVPGAGRDQYLTQLSRPDGSPLTGDEVPSARALHGEPVIGTELVLRRPDGREVSILANAAPVQDARGQVTGAVVIWQDITPLKLERLREEFISMVAHELRTPIGVITGYAGMLCRGQQGEMLPRVAENILQSARRLDRMVGDLLDASRIEAQRLQLEKRLVQLDILVRDVVERLKESLGDHRVRVAVNGDPASVEADPGRIEQVLSNLLTNAAKYSSALSEIRVEVTARPDEVVVSVANEGAGIAPEEMPRLFSRFYRTRAARQGEASGLGLGLYVARGLVEAHGGRIWASSKSGEGTTFSFSLSVSGARSRNTVK